MCWQLQMSYKMVMQGTRLNFLRVPEVFEKNDIVFRERVTKPISASNIKFS